MGTHHRSKTGWGVGEEEAGDPDAEVAKTLTVNRDLHWTGIQLTQLRARNTGQGERGLGGQLPPPKGWAVPSGPCAGLEEGWG